MSGLWHLTDRLGSVRVVLNAAGRVIGRHDPLPFGDITDEENESGTSLQRGQTAAVPGEATTGAHNWYNTMRSRFAQTEADAGTGLEHTLWRKYDAWQGRWTTPDPYIGSMSMADPQSFNRYAYCYNDPVNFVDPDGRNPLIVIGFAAGVVGSGVSIILCK
jgi:RHS repeat-associated protein